jgi:hypothetical protein
VGRLAELEGRLFVLAREGAPAKVHQRELAELEPHSELGLLLVLELPSEVWGSPVDVSGLEPTGSSVVVSMLGLLVTVLVVY